MTGPQVQGLRSVWRRIVTNLREDAPGWPTTPFEFPAVHPQTEQGFVPIRGRFNRFLTDWTEELPTQFYRRLLGIKRAL